MPPYMYWPSDEAKIVYRRSAFNNRVLKADIKDVLSLHLFEAHTYKGRPSKWDEVYGGGKGSFAPPWPLRRFLADVCWKSVSVRISENRTKCVPRFMPGISNRNRPRGGGPVSMRIMPVNTSCSRYQNFGQQMGSGPFISNKWTS